MRGSRLPAAQNHRRFRFPDSLCHCQRCPRATSSQRAAAYLSGAPCCRISIPRSRCVVVLCSAQIRTSPVFWPQPAASAFTRPAQEGFCLPCESRTSWIPRLRLTNAALWQFRSKRSLGLLNLWRKRAAGHPLHILDALCRDPQPRARSITSSPPAIHEPFPAG